MNIKLYGASFRAYQHKQMPEKMTVQVQDLRDTTTVHFFIPHCETLGELRMQIMEKVEVITATEKGVETFISEGWGTEKEFMVEHSRFKKLRGAGIL